MSLRFLENVDPSLPVVTGAVAASHRANPVLAVLIGSGDLRAVGGTFFDDEVDELFRVIVRMRVDDRLAVAKAARQRLLCQIRPRVRLLLCWAALGLE